MERYKGTSKEVSFEWSHHSTLSRLCKPFDFPNTGYSSPVSDFPPSPPWVKQVTITYHRVNVYS